MGGLPPDAPEPPGWIKSVWVADTIGTGGRIIPEYADAFQRVQDVLGNQS